MCGVKCGSYMPPWHCWPLCLWNHQHVGSQTWLTFTGTVLSWWAIVTWAATVSQSVSVTIGRLHVRHAITTLDLVYSVPWFLDHLCPTMVNLWKNRNILILSKKVISHFACLKVRLVAQTLLHKTLTRDLF